VIAIVGCPSNWTHRNIGGINAACGLHDWKMNEPDGHVLYRRTFVTPLAV
jgi:hypothetical protein